MSGPAVRASRTLMTTPLPQDDLTHHPGSAPIEARAPVGGPSPWVGLALIGALAVPLFFLGMGRFALLDPDEPYYAVPALEMLRAGVWRVPLLHGLPWFDKPVLFYWIVLGSFRVLGVTELAARIGSGLAGLAGAAALFIH